MHYSLSAMLEACTVSYPVFVLYSIIYFVFELDFGVGENGDIEHEHWFWLCAMYHELFWTLYIQTKHKHH